MDLANDFGTNKGNVYVNTFNFHVGYRTEMPNYRYLWLAFHPEKTAVHTLNDSHFDYNNPYYEINYGVGAPYGTYIQQSLIGNNPANCTKAYLQRFASQFVKADGSSNNVDFWWKHIQSNYIYYPKRAGTYYITDPVCFAPFEKFDKKDFVDLVDTRYDKKKKASDYAFQTGNYVMAIINHPTQSQYLFERMYFTDNSAASLNFTQKYCALKGASDPVHCVKGLSGAYRGIDIAKNGRLYNLAGFEQIAILPVKISLAGQASGTIVGGPFAYQWWQQTLGSKANYWDYDNVNSSGTEVPHSIPQQATTWKIIKQW
jgi:hypothetical protein